MRRSGVRVSFWAHSEAFLSQLLKEAFLFQHPLYLLFDGTLVAHLTTKSHNTQLFQSDQKFQRSMQGLFALGSMLSLRGF